MAILRGKCHSTVKSANLFIKPYDFVECTPDFSMKFGSMVTKLLSFSIFNIHLSIFVSIYFKTTTLYLGAKNKIFSYIKATPTKKIGHKGFLRGKISTDHADLRGFSFPTLF